MFKHLPGRVELFVFAVLAFVCAVVVVQVGAHDTGLSLLSFPVFIFAAVMGLWRSGRLRATDDLE